MKNIDKINGKNINYNRMCVKFSSKSENESFARLVAAAFVTRLDPTLEEIEDIKTAVSEAVTNSIIHGYGTDEGIIEMECVLKEEKLLSRLKIKAWE